MHISEVDALEILDAGRFSARNANVVDEQSLRARSLPQSGVQASVDDGEGRAPALEAAHGDLGDLFRLKGLFLWRGQNIKPDLSEALERHSRPVRNGWMDQSQLLSVGCARRFPAVSNSTVAAIRSTER
jgi:hypothetical protein